MRVIKCDFCKKQVKGEPITAGIGFLNSVELCEKCGLPIKRFLKKNEAKLKNKQAKKYT